MNLSRGQLQCLFNSAWVFRCASCGKEQKDECDKVEDCLLIDWIMRKMREGVK